MMEPDGRYRVLAQGMQSNGTIVGRTGHLSSATCSVTAWSNSIRRTGACCACWLDTSTPARSTSQRSRDGRQGRDLRHRPGSFTPEEKKSQPGKQVYYIAPDGSARVVIGPGEYAMPNGVEISPDGKTLYVNNTWQQPGENFVWAYDVAADGSLSKKRRFATVELAPEALKAPNPADRFASGADGSAVDTDGRYLRRHDNRRADLPSDGTAAGTIRVPQPPVSVTFGGPGNSVLYIVGNHRSGRSRRRSMGSVFHPG